MPESSKTNLFRQESLERLSSPEQLDQLMQIVNSRSWIPLAAMGGLMAIALLWSVFGRVAITVSGRGLLVANEGESELVGLVYLPASEGQQIQPGMEVLLVPDGISAARTGGVMGTVKTVSTPMVTTLDSARDAVNQDATSLYGSRIEVLAQLQASEDTSSGYKWSSANGDKMMLSAGSTAHARVTLEEKAPIAFVFPFLDF